MNLTDEQRELIRQFVDMPEMAAAVKAALLTGIHHDGTRFNPEKNWVFEVSTELDDAEYGRAVKVKAEAHILVGRTFATLRQIAAGNPQGKPVNQAR